MISLTKNIVRRVSTLSPLATAFNKLNHKIDILPRLFETPTGLFGYDILRDPSGFYLLKEQAIIEAESLINEALHVNRKRKMVEIFDNLSNCLCKVADMAEFVRIGHPLKKFAISAEQASIAISGQVEKLNTNKQLYNALKKIVDNGDIFSTNDTDDHVARLFLYDFEQCGIHLGHDDRKLVVKLNEYILHVGSYFMNGTSQPRLIARAQVPEEIRSCFKTDGDYIIVNGLYNDHDNELVREVGYRIFLYPDDHQENLLRELIQARFRLAVTCGFESYAHRAINRSIANSPESVLELLNNVNDKLMPMSLGDYDEMLKLKSSDNRHGRSLNSWDIPYYTSIYKHSQYNENILSCAPYFSLGSCMDGLNIIFNSLYNVRLSVSQVRSGEVWHHDVIKLSVIDNHDNQTLGYIYCDFFDRPDKPHHDCHFTIQGGCQLSDGGYQLPIVVLILSLPSGTNNCPSLLSPQMVDNLFHEMGHAMHSMLGRTLYQHITGTRCSTDLAEVPSILMEFFASDPRVVLKFAKHFQTGQTIPKNLLNSWIQSKHVFLASDMQLQVFYSALDQAYHSCQPFRGKRSTTQVLIDIQNKYYKLPYVENTAWQLRFSHLVGYGAKYYSYLVSKSVAFSIWNKLFINNPLSSTAGHMFKQQVLVHGGGKPSRDIVNNVLDKDISAEFMANSLIEYINCANKINK